MVLGFSVAGCAHRPEVAPAAGIPSAGESVVLHEGEYEYVTITGSMIPVLVSKSPLARTVPPTSPVVTMSPEAFRRLIERPTTVNR